MNRQRIIFTTVIIFVSLFLVWLGLRMFRDQVMPGEEIATSTAPIFPSGEIRPDDLGQNSFFDHLSTSTSSEPNFNTDELPPSERTGRFYRVSNRPIGGAILLGAGTTSNLIYVEKSTGHLFHLIGTAITPERISNTTIPKIYKLTAGRTGTTTHIAFQYLKDDQIQTFLGRVSLPDKTLGEAFLNNPNSDDNAPTTEAIAGTLLAGKITGLAVAPTLDKLLLLEAATNNLQTYVVLFDLKNSKRETLVTLPLTEWHASWLTSDVIAFQTKSASNYPGSLYFYYVKTKKLELIVNNVPGLTALPSPKLDKIFYSGQVDNRLVAGFYAPAQKFFSRLNIQTWAEKCVWNATGTTLYCAAPSSLTAGDYPDLWYRGETSLSDNLWKIDPAGGKSELIFNPSLGQTGLQIDAERLILSSDESTLYLGNRQDGNLWALSLAGSF